jgi:hypothetical protein
MSHQKLAMCIQTRHILTKTAGPSDAILRLLGGAPARRMPVGLKAGLVVAGLGAGVGSALAAREMLIRQLANNVIKNTPELTASGVGSQVLTGISNAKNKVDQGIGDFISTYLPTSMNQVKGKIQHFVDSEANKSISRTGNPVAQGVDDTMTLAYNTVIRDRGAEKWVQDNLAPGIKNLSKAVQNSETNKAVSEVGNSFAQKVDDGISGAYNYLFGNL